MRRNVWAISFDIDAAAAEGYIMLLTFDPVRHRITGITYSPMLDDYVFNQDAIGRERFTLRDAF